MVFQRCDDFCKFEECDRVLEENVMCIIINNCIDNTANDTKYLMIGLFVGVISAICSVVVGACLGKELNISYTLIC